MVTAYPDDAEINFQTAVAHGNLGFGREAIPYYKQALALRIAGKDRERTLLGLGSIYRGLGHYQEALERGP